MAKSIVPTQLGAPPPVNYYDLLNELIDIKGAMRLARDGLEKAGDNFVGNVDRDEIVDPKELISAAHSVLGMAMQTLEHTYAQLDHSAIRESCPKSDEAVAHG